MTRTYGTYAWSAVTVGPDSPGRERFGVRDGVWTLAMEPAVTARAKRVFARALGNRQGHVAVAHSLEVARDLSWFMERYPLAPVDEISETKLLEATAAHMELEQQVGRIIAGEAGTLRIPPTVMKTARDYQLQALQLVRARQRILLGDAVGLGKTFTSLLTTTLDGALPAVVIPPTHLPPRWLTEIADAFPGLTTHVAKKSIPNAAAFEGKLADITIVPYSKIHGWSNVLAPLVRTVICDEAQELRHGVGTQKGAAVAHLAAEATYVIGATATPVYNYGSEIWNIADILSPGELGTRDEFLREWGGATMTNGRAMVKNPHALGSYMRESGFLLARTREDVGRELPKTIKHTIDVDFDSTALDDVKGDLAKLAKLILNGSTDRQERFQASGEIDWKMRQATGVGKAPFVAEFAKLLLESEQKIVIWAWHREVHEILMRELREFHPMLYTGTESPAQKARAEAAFTTPPLDPNDPHVTEEQLRAQCRVLIMSLRSGSGVDGLQKVASVGMFAELDWSPQVHEQGIGRLRRDGMGDAPPVIYYAVTSEGSDPALMEVLGIKRRQSEQLMSKDGQLFNDFTTDPNRARRLARQVLGLPTEQEQAS